MFHPAIWQVFDAKRWGNTGQYVFDRARLQEVAWRQEIAPSHRELPLAQPEHRIGQARYSSRLRNTLPTATRNLDCCIRQKQLRKPDLRASGGRDPFIDFVSCSPSWQIVAEGCEEHALVGRRTATDA